MGVAGLIALALGPALLPVVIPGPIIGAVFGDILIDHPAVRVVAHDGGADGLVILVEGRIEIRILSHPVLVGDNAAVGIVLGALPHHGGVMDVRGAVAVDIVPGDAVEDLGPPGVRIVLGPDEVGPAVDQEVMLIGCQDKGVPKPARGVADLIKGLVRPDPGAVRGVEPFAGRLLAAHLIGVDVVGEVTIQPAAVKLIPGVVIGILDQLDAQHVDVGKGAGVGAVAVVGPREG